MKNSKILMSILALLSVGVSARAEDVPKRLTFERYSGMLENSPFALATAVAPPAATPSFAKDLYLSSAAKSPEGDMITILSSSDRNFRKYLTTREPVDGYSIANIEWSDRVGETKATISKDGQFATLGFNQSLMTQPAPNVPMMPPTAKEAGVPPPVVSSVAQPPMGVKPNVQANVQAPNAQVMPTPQVMPPPNTRMRGVIKRSPNSDKTAAPPNVSNKPTDVDE